VGRERYVLRSEEAQPFPELLRDLRRAEQSRVEQHLRRRPALTEMASEFLRGVKSILEECGPQAHGSYQLFHSDADHQLQHSRGQWQLVRGPVANRMRALKLFVGLHLVGRRRQDWLSVAPRLGARQEDFWTPRGGPLRRGICVGDHGQYRRLLSRQFSDAEALLEWVDAGVILGTGRSEWHRRLWAGREEFQHGPRAARLRRARR
jgi:hypothetical protein